MLMQSWLRGVQSLLKRSRRMSRVTRRRQRAEGAVSAEVLEVRSLLAANIIATLAEAGGGDECPEYTGQNMAQATTADDAVSGNSEFEAVAEDPVAEDPWIECGLPSKWENWNVSTTVELSLGNVSGWTGNITHTGSVQLVTATEMVGGPVGSPVALLTAGDANQPVTLSHSFSVQPGDVISGWSYFHASDYLPWDDLGGVRLLGDDGRVITELMTSSVSEVGDFGQTGWIAWQYIAQTEMTITVEAWVVNAGDSLFDSQVGLCDVQLQRQETALGVDEETQAIQSADTVDDAVAVGTALLKLETFDDGLVSITPDEIELDDNGTAEDRETSENVDDIDLAFTNFMSPL